MKFISEIKVKTQSLKDKRKNVRKLLDCIKGLRQADDYLSCKLLCYYLSLDSQEQCQYFSLLVREHTEMTKQLDDVGKTIIFLRGDKWSF